MFENLNWNTETILVLGIVTFVACALLGLVIWNSKTNKQVKTLISIDDSLKHLDAIEPETQPSAELPVETVQLQEVAEIEPAEDAEVVEEIQEPENRTNVGRSGKIYTKEELEALIR